VIVLIAVWAGSAGAVAHAGQAVTSPAPPSDPAQAQAAGDTAPSQMTDIHDIKGLMDLGGAFPPAVYGLMVALAMLLLGLTLYVMKRRARTKPPPLLPSPEKAALSRLAGIRDVGALGARAFYFRLSAILRTYLQGRYGLNAPEMTTEEILPRIGSLDLPADLAARLEALLLSADPIKFAAVPASREQMETDLDFAVLFVERTTPPAGEAQPKKEPPLGNFTTTSRLATRNP
jgi:hypothetical protein